MHGVCKARGGGRTRQSSTVTQSGVAGPMF